MAAHSELFKEQMESLYVHFSNRHINYYTAWLYTTKEDRNYIQSPDHRDLANSGPQRTTSARQARKKRSVPGITSGLFFHYENSYVVIAQTASVDISTDSKLQKLFARI